MGKFQLEALRTWPFIVGGGSSWTKGLWCSILVMSWSLVLPSECVCVWGVR